jgi:hypothetical protein
METGMDCVLGTKTKEVHSSVSEFEEDVVNCRVGVAGD